MRCGICVKRQIEYEVRTLSVKERAAVEAHLESCASCRRFYEEMARLRESLPPLDRETPRRDLWPSIAARLTPRKREVVPQRLLRPALAVTMIAIVAAVATTFLTTPQPGPLPGAEGTVAMVKDSEIGEVWSDPWAGPVAQALDWVLTDQPQPKLD